MSEEAILLALLSNNRADTSDQPDITIGTKGLLHILERTENHIGEGGSKSDGVFEIGDREIVLTGEDDFVGEVVESIVGVECVEFLLCLNCCESSDNEVASTLVVDLVAFNVVCDVV